MVDEEKPHLFAFRGIQQALICCPHWGLWHPLTSETDVEGVVAQLVAGPTLVEAVVAVQHGLDGQGGLPGTVADLEIVILMIYKH